MNQYSHPRITETARRIPFLCGLIFLCFSFVFFYRSQSFIQAQAQRVASPDSPAFHPVFTAVFCTILLWLLGVLLNRLCRFLPLRLKALPWFFSFLGLGILTQWHFTQLGDVQSSCGVIFYIIIGLLYAGLFALGFLARDSENENNSIFSYYWINLLLMFIFMAISVRISNTDRLVHHTLKTDQLLYERNYDGVIAYCKTCPALTRSQTSMLAISLSQKGEMGEHLFDYPMNAGSEGLVAQTGDSVLLSNPHAMQGHLLGYKRGTHVSSSEFLHVLPQYRNAKSASLDYRLCDYLLNKQLIQFVSLLKNSNDSLSADLPRYYKEAIILYQHTSNNPSTNYVDDATESNFQDFLELKKSGTKHSQALNCREMFGTTYWYYFYFL